MNKSHQNDTSPPLLTLFSTSPLPTEWGDFETRVYRTTSGEEHMAIVRGDLSNGEPALVRVHSACFTGEVLGSLKCDCKAQLNEALKEISATGRGVVIYLFQEGRGIGLGNKIKAYALQAEGVDTVDANRHLGFGDDDRVYDLAVAILEDLAVQQVRLMTNNPLKIEALREAGLEVTERVSIEVGRNHVNAEYLDTKRDRMSHMLKAK